MIQSSMSGSPLTLALAIQGSSTYLQRIILIQRWRQVKQGRSQQRGGCLTNKSTSQLRISYKLCVLIHLVHTNNSPSYLSDLVTTTANIPSRIRLRSASNHRYEPLTTRLKFGERCFPMQGLKLGTACPMQFRK